MYNRRFRQMLVGGTCWSSLSPIRLNTCLKFVEHYFVLHTVRWRDLFIECSLSAASYPSADLTFL